MSKNWFLLASVSCGVGFGSTFLISRNLQQSTLAGLATVPAVGASLTILSRQRREEIERQVAESRLGLDDARKQEQLTRGSYSKISADEQELQTALTKLQQAVNRDRKEQEGLEKNINSLVLKKQTQESLLVRLDAEVLDRQNNLQTTQAQLAQIQTQRQSLQQEIISDLLLQKQDQKVLFDRLLADISTKQNNLFKLDTDISKKQADLNKISIDLVRAEERNKFAIDSAQTSELALSNINIEIADLQNQEKNLQAEIATQKVYRTEVQQQTSVLEEQQEQISTSVNDLNRSRQEQQSLLDDLNLEIWNQQQYKANIHSEITELENSISLFSAHDTGKVLDIGIADLYRRWLQVSQQVSPLENESSIIAPNPVIEPEPSIITAEWESHLTSNPYLPVFQHIDRWGSITESEVNNILGDARRGRQFNHNFREYYQYLPFAIRVETLNNSIRYVKEIIIISDSQHLLSIPQREILDRHIEPEQYIAEPEDDYLGERMIHSYPVCLFCERPPMPGQDRCNNCN